MVRTENKNIGLITSPIGITNRNQLSNFAHIVSSISDHLYFITGNAGSDVLVNSKKVHIYPINYNIQKNQFSKILHYILLQLKISCKFFQIHKNAKIWIFFHGSGTLLLPVFIAKLLRKKVVLILPGSSNALKYERNPFYKIVRILEAINLTLSDKIVIYSKILVEQWNLERYTHKICIAHEHFLDFSSFSIKNSYEKRECLIGYVGRLSEEKGILNLIEAIPQIIKCNENLKFLILGEGKLRNQIESYLIENNTDNRVTLAGWISFNELPKYLNQMRLLVLPSYTEGLPNVILEAMACGTPVLTTPVGAVPDVVKNEITGFILANNSPACITKSVVNTLEYPGIDQVIKNAHYFVEKEFSYENAVEIFKEILQNINAPKENTFWQHIEKPLTSKERE